MTTDTNTDKFQALQAALTKLAASGVSIQFAEIYQCGSTYTAIVMTNVKIDERGRLVMVENA